MISSLDDTFVVKSEHFQKVCKKEASIYRKVYMKAKRPTLHDEKNVKFGVRGARLML